VHPRYAQCNVSLLRNQIVAIGTKLTSPLRPILLSYRAVLGLRLLWRLINHVSGRVLLSLVRQPKVHKRQVVVLSPLKEKGPPQGGPSDSWRIEMKWAHHTLAPGRIALRRIRTGGASGGTVRECFA
jgi:hypothetical protein